jgi:hypothetical protein
LLRVEFVFAIVLSEKMVVLCKPNVLLVAAERFNTKTNSPRVGVVSSPAGL